MPPGPTLRAEANDHALSSLIFSLRSCLADTEKPGGMEHLPLKLSVNYGTPPPSSSPHPAPALRTSRAWEMHFNRQFLSVPLTGPPPLPSLQETIYKTTFWKQSSNAD